MTKLIRFSTIIFLCTITTVSLSVIQITFEDDFAKSILRFDSDVDGELVSASVGAAYRTKTENAGFYWISITGTAYTGGNIWFQGTYKVKAEIVPFFVEESGSFEGPIEANQSEMMDLSIHPPPQNEDMPNIGRCNANSEIKGGGLKAKSSI